MPCRARLSVAIAAIYTSALLRIHSEQDELKSFRRKLQIANLSNSYLTLKQCSLQIL